MLPKDKDPLVLLKAAREVLSEVYVREGLEVAYHIVGKIDDYFSWRHDGNFKHYSSNMEDFYRDVADWHDSSWRETRSVYEFLGITEEQYRKLVESKNAGQK